MTSSRFHQLFGEPARKPESPLTQKHMDIASSIQTVTEEIVLKLAQSVHRDLGQDYLCLAGGVALNCVANGRLLREGPFKDIWIQPAAGDAGGAVGAALCAWHSQFKGERVSLGARRDQMQGSYLGPQSSDLEVLNDLEKEGAVFTRLPHSELLAKAAQRLEEGAVIGWVQGRMEFGPRALGGRSIIGDPRSPRMQAVMNLKIKFRESFRPFAPAVLAEDVGKYFELDRPSPYMLLVAPVKADIRTTPAADTESLFGIEKLNVPRSSIPAVTHVDYSARVQTVHPDTNPIFYELLTAFKQRTGCSVLVNTSFNVRGEPIVCGPEDAFRCFMRTEMDCLVVGNFWLEKKDQTGSWLDKENWRQEYELD